MQWRRLVLVALIGACSGRGPALPKRPPAPVVEEPAVGAGGIEARVLVQQRAIEAFFGEPMPRPYALRVRATRKAMEAFAAEMWKLPELPCWAVAVGTGTTLLLLEPAAWKTEACDHAGDGPAEVDRVIAHELVHVFHGQHRPDDVELEKAEAVGWFVEGLATYAAGQLDEARLAQVAALVAGGGGPARLDEAWSGKARYAVAGTLARLVDRRVGRARLRELLPMSTNAELLAAIGMTEAELLEAWRRSVSDSR